jgi:hypothetical protein
MSDLYKFGWLPDEQNEERYEYANLWAREKTSGPDRLVIAPRTHYVELLKKLVACMQEPYLLLYVLVVPRGEGDAGRYQSEFSFTFEQLEKFLDDHSDFFDNDARHNLWIHSASGDGLLVYDRHNVIYAYGPLEQFIAALTSNGLNESKEICFPSPHVHHYHAEFDSESQRILQQETWIMSPLRPTDENP